ncbi:MAG TPA: carbonic anhydrase family protein [Kofleriaceae bacterium]|nr:carbonic anhydrase family protein [Kofleriaceae bacterium]
MRRHLVLLLALAGCKYVDGPKKVAELEKRVDELSDAVSELTGKPVGQRPKAKDDGDGAADAKKGGKDRKKAGKDARAGKKDDAGDGDAKDARDAKDSNDSKDDSDAKSARGSKDDGDTRLAKADGDARSGSEHAGDRAADAHAEPDPPPPAPAPDVHWSYQGADGPAKWGSLDPAFATCRTGEAQSPIDILPRRSQAPEVIFVYHPATATAVDTGHGLEVDLGPGSFVVVDGTRYDLVQLLVHTPGEHTVAGDGFPMELQLVHKSKRGALAIVALELTEGAPSAALAPLWKALPKGKAPSKLARPFDPTALLPKDTAAYRYDGSLTTPPCTEGVIWYVLRRQATEDPARIDAIAKRFGANARPVQDLGERELQ